MFGNWCLLASQVQARVLTKTSDKKLKVVKEFYNQLGKVRNRELIRKKFGTGVKSLGRAGFVTYRKTKRQSPHDIAAVQFAKTVTDYLDKELQNDGFNSLTVIAEPKFLGKLRSAMRPRLERAVKKSITKDLHKIPKGQLNKFLLETF